MPVQRCLEVCLQKLAVPTVVKLKVHVHTMMIAWVTHHRTCLSDLTGLRFNLNESLPLKMSMGR
jgi:hypothetical protein